METSGLKNRSRWAINYVIDARKLSNDRLAQVMGVNVGTVNNYRTMRTDPRISFIEKFCKLYGFDYKWFMFGEGEPFPGAREKYPEICGPHVFQAFHFPGSSSAGKLPNTPPEGEDEMRGTKLSDDIAMAARILESRTPYATALRLNIQAFGRAMSSEQRITQVEQRVTTSESQLLQKLDDLTSRLQELETRNAELESHTPPPPDKPTPPDEEKE
ncbi:MAG TPA: hypothetical protein DDZ88_29975 [Verrucomicrobiales bacterium]|nr:hypothetical protein [Verrucomicrobiales bacterium]